MPELPPSERRLNPSSPGSSQGEPAPVQLEPALSPVFRHVFGEPEPDTEDLNRLATHLATHYLAPENNRMLATTLTPLCQFILASLVADRIMTIDYSRILNVIESVLRELSIKRPGQFHSILENINYIAQLPLHPNEGPAATVAAPDYSTLANYLSAAPGNNLFNYFVFYVNHLQSPEPRYRRRDTGAHIDNVAIFMLLITVLANRSLPAAKAAVWSRLAGRLSSLSVPAPRSEQVEVTDRAGVLSRLPGSAGASH
jgi:hypothetical protein